MTAFDSVHRSAGMTAKCFNQLALRTHASAGKSFASTRLNATLSLRANGAGNWGMFYSSISGNFVKKIMQQPLRCSSVFNTLVDALQSCRR